MVAVSRKFKPVLFFLVSLMIVTITVSGLVLAETPKKPEPVPGDLMILSNQYVKVVVNAGDFNSGRFALETTGGAPDIPGDDNKPLIYGRPRPWTSYTTVRIDNQDYVFGGQTEQRAGRGAKYGILVQPPVTEDGTIRTTWQLGPIEVTQILRIITSTTTGWPDTMEIRYAMVNKDKKSHQVGLRMLLDTMLGANDGAPFRIGEKAVTVDTVFSGEMPEFWQAFDSVQEPSVTAQGTLRGSLVTTPDKVYISNWGSMADGAWDFDFKPGRELIRAGEYESDSAVALRWEPKKLAPGEERVVVTAYGLGGITIAPGELSLGITSPATVWADAKGKIRIPVVAYLQNTSASKASNVRLTLNLPAGLSLSSGQRTVRVIGELASKGTSQVAWDVTADPSLAGKSVTYSVTVEATNARPNTVQRSVQVLAPPRLKLTLTAPKELQIADEHYVPDGFPVQARLENQGGAPAYQVSAALEPGSGLDLGPMDKGTRYLGTLKPGEAVDVAWLAQPEKQAAGQLTYKVTAVTGTMGSVQVQGSIKVPALDPKVRFSVPSAAPVVGGYFTMDVLLSNANAVSGSKFMVRYDPKLLQLVRTSRGTLFVGEGTGWEVSPSSGSGESGLIQGTCPARWVELESLAGLSFRVLAPGKTKVELIQVEVSSDKTAQAVKVAGTAEIVIANP